MIYYSLLLPFRPLIVFVGKSKDLQALKRSTHLADKNLCSSSAITSKKLDRKFSIEGRRYIASIVTGRQRYIKTSTSGRDFVIQSFLTPRKVFDQNLSMPLKDDQKPETTSTSTSKFQFCSDAFHSSATNRFSAKFVISLLLTLFQQFRFLQKCAHRALFLAFSELPGLTSQRHSALISSDSEYFQVCFSAVHYLKISEQR